MQLDIAALDATPPAEAPLELVERKGLGHPDSLCDALAEAASRALGRYYLEHHGSVLHHNLDKALLVGGAARPAFGGGEVLAPMEFILAGRATTRVRGRPVPVERVVLAACREWLATHMPRLDLDRHIRFDTRIRPSSAELVGLFGRPGRSALANDTAIGVGYAPLDSLERTVLAVERRLTAPATRAAHPYLGEDVKVMGARSAAGVSLTVAAALVGRHLADLGAYRQARARVAALATEAARATAGTAPVELSVNAADGDSADSVYMTVTGTSAEAGDDGQVGRGNRVNGLITPCRPMSMEAAAGKNPVSHVGKLYNLLASRLAASLVDSLAEVEEAECFLLSRIGQPVDRPWALALRLRTAPGVPLSAVSARAGELALEALSGVGGLWRELLAGRIALV